MVHSEGPPEDAGPELITPKIIFYVLNVLVIFVPLGGMLFFMFDADAFDAFLNWKVRLF